MLLLKSNLSTQIVTKFQTTILLDISKENPTDGAEPLAIKEQNVYLISILMPGIGVLLFFEDESVYCESTSQWHLPFSSTPGIHS